ncbi:cysteine desulfurase NifS [Candidatus Dependentiae bacterium]|nr:cysteine desulfurase NifS [Candidatus Dependentiae bacterium]
MNLSKNIYFDNNATTKVAPEVLQEILPYFSEYYGNPSSAHSFGGNVAKKLKTAKEKIAGLLGADSEDEIIITSCGTESDNTAINSVLLSYPEKKHIVTTKVEHPAVLNYCKYLMQRGYKITFLNVDEKGRLNLDELEKSINQDTAIVSIMWANNETGTVFPVLKIAEIVKSKGSLLHTDAVQTVGKIEIDLKKSNIDMLSLSGHKLHAPKGVGVLYLKKKTLFKPFMIGGHQENGLRAGTENVASIIGLGKAAELAGKHIKYENSEVKRLRDKLESGLIEKIKLVKINGDIENRLPNTVNISFKNVEGEAILLYMNEKQICASSGSACTTGSLEPSHVLMAMSVPYEYAHGSIRFSLSRYNVEEEVDEVIRTMPDIIEKLRAMSPFND